MWLRDRHESAINLCNRRTKEKKRGEKKKPKKKKKAERTTRACVKRNGHRTKATIEPRPRLNENREAILASLWTVRKAVQTRKKGERSNSGKRFMQWEETFYTIVTPVPILFPLPPPALSELNIPSGLVHPADSGDIFEIRQSASNIWLCTFHCQDSCWHGRTADSRYQFCLSSKLFTRPSFHSVTTRNRLYRFSPSPLSLLGRFSKKRIRPLYLTFW